MSGKRPTPGWVYIAVLGIVAIFALGIVLPALSQALAALQNVIAMLP